MTLAVALLCALGLQAAAPAQAQAVEAQYREAVDARKAGDPKRAASLLGTVTAAQPQNADAQLQLGLALLALGQLPEAEAAFRTTLALAPEYADARIGLSRALQRRGDPRTALVELDRVRDGNVDATGLRRQLKQALADSAPWRVDLDGSYSAVGLGQPNWKEASLRISRRLTPATAVQAAVESARRFGSSDMYGEVRVERRFPSGGGSAYLLGGVTPNADFRPRWQLGAGGEVRVRPGGSATVLTLDGRAARYRAGQIQTLNPGIDQYLAAGRAWIGLRWINVFDKAGHHGGWLARADLMATDRLRLYAGTAKAPETEQGVVVETSSLFGGLSFDLTAGTAVRASIARDNPGKGARRVQLGLGVGSKF